MTLQGQEIIRKILPSWFKKKYDFKLNENIENINKEKEVKERNEKSDINLQNMPILDDLVVHLTHGIGRFKGLKQIDTFIGVSDCLEIEYAENSRVYVPIEHMHLVSRYFVFLKWHVI